MVEWLLENWESLLELVTIVVVVALYLYIRYADQQGRLRADLDKIVRDGLERLKGWAGDNLDDVTEEDVCKVADWFHARYVAGTVLERLASKERLRARFWLGFCRWRDEFIEVNVLMAG